MFEWPLEDGDRRDDERAEEPKRTRRGGRGKR
jgi:hypothetical protein